MHHVTIPAPDDFDLTEPPLYEGNDGQLPLADRTYLATRTHDGAEGIVTVKDGHGRFVPFTRTPSTYVGHIDADGDYLCGTDCPAAPDEGTGALSALTLANLTDGIPAGCSGCGMTLLDYDTVLATCDVFHAMLAATGLHGHVEGTGGGCEAYRVHLPDGRMVSVTDGDAGRPDGIAMAVVIYDGDADAVTVYEGVHDPSRAARATERYLFAPAVPETEDERDHRETAPDGDARTYDPETGAKIEPEGGVVFAPAPGGIQYDPETGEFSTRPVWHLLITDYYEPVASHTFDSEDDAKAAAVTITRDLLLREHRGDLDHDLAERIATDPRDLWLDGEGSDVLITEVTPYTVTR